MSLIFPPPGKFGKFRRLARILALLATLYGVLAILGFYVIPWNKIFPGILNTAREKPEPQLESRSFPQSHEKKQPPHRRKSLDTPLKTNAFGTLESPSPEFLKPYLPGQKPDYIPTDEISRKLPWHDGAIRDVLLKQQALLNNPNSPWKISTRKLSGSAGNKVSPGKNSSEEEEIDVDQAPSILWRNITPGLQNVSVISLILQNRESTEENAGRGAVISQVIPEGWKHIGGSPGDFTWNPSTREIKWLIPNAPAQEFWKMSLLIEPETASEEAPLPPSLAVLRRSLPGENTMIESSALDLELNP